jgi:polygalacturonase
MTSKYGFFTALVLFSLIKVPAYSVYRNEKSPIDLIYQEVPFKIGKIELPDFPNKSVSIVDFGAKNDGQTNNTNAFRNAINYIHDNGGGIVRVPEGLWLTGPIEIKSNVCLYTDEGSIILFTTDYDQYPLVKTCYEGAEGWRAMSPIFARNATNIAIKGYGKFDGCGEAWRPVKKNNVNLYQWRDFIESGGVLNEKENIWYPTEKSLAGSKSEKSAESLTYEDAIGIKEWLRPVMLNFVSCNRILIEDAVFVNSPAWCLHPFMCENLTISNISVHNDSWASNGDALDIESCKNVLVYDCSFDAGDDVICLKSGKDDEGRNRNVPTENIIIYNCTAYNGHGGFVIGSEMSGGVRNVFLKKCDFIGTDNGLRFKSGRGRGGVVENIYLSDIKMVEIKNDAILCDMYYGSKGSDSTEYKVDETTPQFRKIWMDNIICKGAKRVAFFQGLPEMKIENIKLENSSIDATKGIECYNAMNIIIKNSTLKIDGKINNYFNETDISTK